MSVGCTIPLASLIIYHGVGVLDHPLEEEGKAKKQTRAERNHLGDHLALEQNSSWMQRTELNRTDASPSFDMLSFLS